MSISYGYCELFRVDPENDSYFDFEVTLLAFDFAHLQFPESDQKDQRNGLKCKQCCVIN